MIAALFDIVNVVASDVKQCVFCSARSNVDRAFTARSNVDGAFTARGNVDRRFTARGKR
jgi:hypothetical protein